jgi:hypothetical protein
MRVTDSIIDGLFFFIVTFIVGWIYFLGGIFEYFIYHYKLFPTEALKLFDVFGKYHKKFLANLFLSCEKWTFQDEKVLQEFNRASRSGGIIWIVLSSISLAFLISNIRHQFLHAITLLDRINYGFWLLLMLLTVLWCIWLAMKIIRTHKALQASIRAYTALKTD